MDAYEDEVDVGAEFAAAMAAPVFCSYEEMMESIRREAEGGGVWTVAAC